MRHDIEFSPGGDGGHIGEVELPLRVVALHGCEPFLQQICRRRDDAGIRLAHTQLFGRSILMLDDLADAPARITQNASVAARIGEHNSENRKSF